jgi:hypothetical protein
VNLLRSHPKNVGSVESFFLDCVDEFVPGGEFKGRVLFELEIFLKDLRGFTLFFSFHFDFGYQFLLYNFRSDIDLKLGILFNSDR